MAPSRFDKEEFALYQKYQVQQHHDDIEDLSPKSYTRFLVDSPLPPPKPTPPLSAPASASADPSTSSSRGSSKGSSHGASSSSHGSSVPQFCGYGSFHMQYRINGRLMAVGVVDVLPRCLSSVYLFWDSDFAHLAPGKLSALKEIEWVQQASKSLPELQHYYMGFYIHTCPKMKYKADYRPSDLLCPESKAWVRISDPVLQALDSQRYVVFSQLPGVQYFPNSAPVGVAAERAPSPASPDAGRQAVAQDSQQHGDRSITAEERREQIMREVEARKQRQQAISRAADDVKAVVFDMVYPWKALKNNSLIVPQDRVGGVQRIIEAWVAVVGELLTAWATNWLECLHALEPCSLACPLGATIE